MDWFKTIQQRKQQIKHWRNSSQLNLNKKKRRIPHRQCQ
ncbi:unnamed protein product [Arabidopsis halleri]